MEPMIKCEACNGDGELETGRRESETGYPITAECPTCHGSGIVAPEPTEAEQLDDDMYDAADEAFSLAYEDEG